MLNRPVNCLPADPNNAWVVQGGKKCSVRVGDVPGHPRIRRRFEQYADRACGVVFLVDAVDFLPHKTEIAEQLYEVLLQRCLPAGFCLIRLTFLWYPGKVFKLVQTY